MPFQETCSRHSSCFSLEALSRNLSRSTGNVSKTSGNRATDTPNTLSGHFRGTLSGTPPETHPETRVTPEIRNTQLCSVWWSKKEPKAGEFWKRFLNGFWKSFGEGSRRNDWGVVSRWESRKDCRKKFCQGPEWSLEGFPEMYRAGISPNKIIVGCQDALPPKFLF